MRVRTFRVAVAGILASAFALAVAATPAAAEQPIHWKVEALPTFSPDVVQFTLTGQLGNSFNELSSPASLNTLEGLTVDQLHSSRQQPVAFHVRRDAGEFACTGIAQGRLAFGDCTFVGRQSFAQLLQSRGVGQAQTADLQRMTMFNVGADYVDELHRLHYVTPTVDELARAGEHGVSIKFIRDMAVAGFPLSDIDGLIMARDHGVDPDYVKAVKVAGYVLAAVDLVKLRDHGVSSEFMAGVKRTLYRELPADDLARLRDHGVSADWLAGLQKAGYGQLSVDQLVGLRDRGVSAEYIAALHQAGYRTLTPTDIILLRDHGVSAGFVEEVVGQGYGDLTVAEVARLRDHGISGHDLRKAAGLGRKLSADDIIRLRDSGVI
jgi:hypothetical protein